MTKDFIQFRNITKTFGGVTALSNVSLSISKGECHALMGENGAGKSTLGKILAGIHRPDTGQILINNAEMSFRSPRDAVRAGVGMVHQELAFCPQLSVAENLCMGSYPRRLAMFLDRADMHRRAEKLLSDIGVSMDVSRNMAELSTAQEQLVQIASAVGTGANILVFDEPTSSLSEHDALRLFTLIESLKQRGVTIIYVSHRMPEVFRLADRISVLRDGQYVGTLPRADATHDSIVRLMIGRPVEPYFPKHLNNLPGQIALSVRNLSSPGKFADISFDLHAGEILGFAGLVGAGRSEVAKAIFGLDSAATGQVKVFDHPLPLGNIKSAMHAGVGLLPEDRKRQGLVLPLSGRQNFSMAMLPRLSRLGFLNFSKERAGAESYFSQLRVKTPSIESPVSSMSGGNQQKVALAKWLARNCKILLIDEPTRGVDIGAKTAIHSLIDDLALQGVAILLISSELPEVLNLSTRILVLREGALVSQVNRPEATQDHLMRLMAGMSHQ
ncbi:MAG TPA: sugar ABC transporter ATP-binding protein [Tepidisphaeraceae bacterium]|nr:sugar ABC transporter ATP-binding protein [Tepidisphaeraceae bacterium]